MWPLKAKENRHFGLKVAKSHPLTQPVGIRRYGSLISINLSGSKLHMISSLCFIRLNEIIQSVS